MHGPDGERFLERLTEDLGENDVGLVKAYTEIDEETGLALAKPENIAAWIWHRLRPDLPGLALVRVAETPMSWAEYDGE